MATPDVRLIEALGPPHPGAQGERGVSGDHRQGVAATLYETLFLGNSASPDLGAGISVTITHTH